MLISLYIYHEYSYDAFHVKGDRIYQLGATFGNEGETQGAVPAAMAEALQQDFPEIAEIARLMALSDDDKTLLQDQESEEGIKSFYETKGFLADPTFFQLFTYDFIAGNPVTALEKPNSIILTEEIAQKIFGKEPALGRVLRVGSNTNGDGDYTVTGVFKPVDSPSHIDARFFMSMRGGIIGEHFLEQPTLVNNNDFYTYLLLNPESTKNQLEQKLPSFIEKRMRKELEAKGEKRSLFLTPLKDIHLDYRLADNITPAVNLTYIRILAAIAFLTLLIACINFMNLSTSRSSKRSVEVGIRKVLGAEKKELIWQFLGESLMMAFVGFLFAIGFVLLLLPLFEIVSGKSINLSLEQHGGMFLAFVVLAIGTGLLAGSYPALYLSSFKPVRVLKGRFSNSLSVTSIRKGLVIFQFVVSVVLIIASVIISSQMSYLRTKDLGFIKEQQVVIPLRSAAAKNNYSTLKDKLSNKLGITAVGASYYYPGIFNPMDWPFYKEGGSPQKAKNVHINFVDDSFLQTLGIQPLEGRLFSPEFPADTNSRIVLNLKGVQELGFSSAKAAIGNWISFDWEGEQNKFTIIGVVQDFHFEDLRTGIEPYGFLLNNSPDQNYLIAHVGSEDIGGTLANIEKTWHSLNPNEPFDYSFLDQDFQKNYQAESRLADIIRYFTIIAIVISCLGLFGLSTFSAEQRIKEIGIRKVLGASVSSLVALLSRDFLKLIFIAILLASPLAWYIMSKWLQTFAYSVDISWQVFAITSFLAVAIAIITISFQAIKAATANPVKNLRTE